MGCGLRSAVRAFSFHSGFPRVSGGGKRGPVAAPGHASRQARRRSRRPRPGGGDPAGPRCRRAGDRGSSSCAGRRGAPASAITTVSMATTAASLDRGVAGDAPTGISLPPMDWDAIAARGERRDADGQSRLPDDPEARQRQLVRIATAAGSVALARLMQGHRDEPGDWFARSAAAYRASWDGSPPGSWGRPIGLLKALARRRHRPGRRGSDLGPLPRPGPKRFADRHVRGRARRARPRTRRRGGRPCGRAQGGRRRLPN